MRPTIALVGLALLATLTAGSVLGAINLARLQVLFVGLSDSVKRLHAFFQLVGLMGGFIAGIAIHVVPRFWKVLPPGRPLATALPALIALALVTRSAGLAWPGQGAWLTVAADALALVAGTLFAAWLLAAWRRAARPASGVDALLVMGAACWPLGALLWTLGEWPGVGEVRWPAGVQAGEEVWLLGLTVGWILGMGPRVLPFFLELAHPGSRRAWCIAACLASGVVLRALALVPCLPPAASGSGLVLIAAALLVWVGASRVWHPRSLPMAGTSGAFAREIVLMCLALGAGALALAIQGAGQILGRAPLHAMVYDAARHSIAVGFALAALMTVSSRLLPTFAGLALPFPRMMSVSIVLLHLGVAGRWTQVLAAYGLPLFLNVSGISGFLVLAGIAGWLANLLTMASRAAHRAPVDAAGAPGTGEVSSPSSEPARSPSAGPAPGGA